MVSGTLHFGCVVHQQCSADRLDVAAQAALPAEVWPVQLWTEGWLVRRCCRWLVLLYVVLRLVLLMLLVLLLAVGEVRT